MAKTTKKENYKGMSDGELEKKLKAFEDSIRVIRWKAEGSKSKNVKEVASLKKDIARISTEISARKNK